MSAGEWREEWGAWDYGYLGAARTAYTVAADEAAYANYIADAAEEADA